VREVAVAQSRLEAAQDRIRDMQTSAARHHDARQALIHGRALRQAGRVERRMRRLAEAAQQLRARIADLESGP
jgi:hypothetical protein